MLFIAFNFSHNNPCLIDFIDNEERFMDETFIFSIYQW